MYNIKRVFIFVALITAVVVISASFVGESVTDRAIIIGIGIDGSAEGVRVTAEVISPSTGEQVGAFSKVVSANGKTVATAIQRIAEITGKEASLKMSEIHSKKIHALRSELESTWKKLQIDAKIQHIAELEQIVAEPELWLDPEKARQANEELAHLSDEVQPWKLIQTQLDDLEELFALNDPDLNSELESQLTAIESDLNELRKVLRFNGKFDHHNAILRITAGVGGTEAMDWAGMLERMYLRWAERKGMKVTNLERSTGEEAGIKTAVYEISGTNAYGLLKSEHGVHRLVRLSPFNADNLRQTSFALVEVLPILDSEDEIKIDDKDLRIDVYHSGGHGGQSVNTTNSAVRITHLPTNTVVAIQNERSQLQNKAKAMEILRGKLAQMQQEQQAESIDKLRAGEAARWGQQIRNYVLQPYKLVKDTRTKYEDKNPENVLDGKIDGFIDAYLELSND